MGKRKVFGVGWAKTGTTSLGRALAMTGRAHTSVRFDMVEEMGRGNMAPLLDLIDAHEAFDDWPWTLLYREMADRHPDALFVLTLRDEADMLRSYRGMLSQEWKRYPRIREARKIIYGFDTEVGTDDQFLERVRRHNAEVRAFFADRPGRLLEMNIIEGDGWETLCPFIGEPVPDAPFPRG